MRLLVILLVGFIVSCNADQNNENQNDSSEISSDSVLITEELVDSLPIVEEYIVDTLEQTIIDAGLTDIQSLCPAILVELRYSTTNNFMEKDVYGHLNRVYLQPKVSEDLVKCYEYLQSIDSSLTLLVYDGVRPRSVQQYMWDILDMPIWEKTKFVSNPANGSLHNYGCAVDLTIANLDGEPLDMGAGYDDSRKIAYPRYEQVYLDSGMLSQDQIDNRILLRDVMKAGGFWNIQTEWWHFNRHNRETAKSLYSIIE